MFCHIYVALLDFFKVRVFYPCLPTIPLHQYFRQALMVPYMSFAWPAFSEHLRKHSTEGANEGQVWLCILQTLTQSMSADEDRGMSTSSSIRS